ncbi:hypothetical protein C7N83_05900, partial [Neisseria iguanae]
SAGVWKWRAGGCEGCRRFTVFGGMTVLRFDAFVFGGGADLFGAVLPGNRPCNSLFDGSGHFLCGFVFLSGTAVLLCLSVTVCSALILRLAAEDGLCGLSGGLLAVVSGNAGVALWSVVCRPCCFLLSGKAVCYRILPFSVGGTLHLSGKCKAV